jgi:NADH:ubiquinone oxidoreductase subunit F (NADH-binding)
VTATRTARRSTGSPPVTPAPPAGSERLLFGLSGGVPTEPFADHVARWGPLPTQRGVDLLAELGRSGLRGRGGAWFPVATKWQAVREARGRRPVVVVNAAEGEPASSKDRFLLSLRPHLVLDGAALAARVVGASEVVLYAPADLLDIVHRAVGERRTHGVDHGHVRLVAAPDAFVAGQESAVVNAVNGREPIPSFVRLRSVRERGIDGRPTLVQNAETLAHVALALRFGAGWFRAVGTEQSPGTTLLTVTGRWPEPRIMEAPLGVPLSTSLQIGSGQVAATSAVLLGGYGGGWVPTDRALAMPLTEEAARAQGASLGAGVVVLLPADRCPLREVAGVTRYLEVSAAGQCGPCVHGLAELADELHALAEQPHRFRGVDHLRTVCDQVEGRGACAHPDGVVRFVRSACTTFAVHIEDHRRGGVCHLTPPVLPIPRAGTPVAPPGTRRRVGRGR